MVLAKPAHKLPVSQLHPHHANPDMCDFIAEFLVFQSGSELSFASVFLGRSNIFAILWRLALFFNLTSALNLMKTE